ncbi:MAG TPA: hypothetical protein EYQ81_09775, partial [Sneathiellales bacterium]|nr:hypothetical protein [Sneathiellales bacterium]
MVKHLLLAAGAGLASAVFILSVAGGSPLGLPLAYLAPLPLFLVAFSQGYSSAVIAAVCGSIAMAGALGPATGATFFLTTGLAPMILSRQALQWRKGPDGTQNWYPAGRLLTLLTVSAAVFFLIVFVGFFTQDGGLPKAVENYMLEIAANYDLMADRNQLPALATFGDAIRNAAPEISRMLPGSFRKKVSRPCPGPSASCIMMMSSGRTGKGNCVWWARNSPQRRRSDQACTSFITPPLANSGAIQNAPLESFNL